ncbi:MAG: tetratricopeptide repeat protein [Proteobacteria bacterium]|uniref:tetratricopeptide repeat protein n=1 Tax=Rudaea sp. TaxID=2136325 RepID=UPI00321FD1BA|nr:tetratricopeptide repeat protein [Pseudomonadota bacterium]
MNYTKGTQALEAKNYAEAIPYLEKAVQEDPSMARNHNNLAAAYFEVGRVRDGWPYTRKAVLMEPCSDVFLANFRRYVKALIKEHVIEEGLSEDEVRTRLGPPDGTQQTSECAYWQYGGTALCLKTGHVAGINDMIRQCR